MTITNRREHGEPFLLEIKFKVFQLLNKRESYTLLAHTFPLPYDPSFPLAALIKTLHAVNDSEQRERKGMH